MIQQYMKCGGSHVGSQTFFSFIFGGVGGGCLQLTKCCSVLSCSTTLHISPKLAAQTWNFIKIPEILSFAMNRKCQTSTCISGNWIKIYSYWFQQKITILNYQSEILPIEQNLIRNLLLVSIYKSVWQISSVDILSIPSKYILTI